LNNPQFDVMDLPDSADSFSDGATGTKSASSDAAVRKERKRRPAANRTPAAPRAVSVRKSRATRQPGKRVPGTQAETADPLVSFLDEGSSKLAPGSGTTLRIVPVGGFTGKSSRVPLDLNFLEWNCKPLDGVEPSPVAERAQSKPVAASVLELLAKAMGAREMGQAAAMPVNAPEEIRVHPAEVPSVALPGQEPLAEQQEQAEQAGQEICDDAETETARPAKKWWHRWLFPEPQDPRSAPREVVPGLAAYYWTGGAPIQHEVRDVSESGMYVATHERWYPGTVVRMTLIDSADPGKERSITVNTRVVRHGKDGVGLQLLLESARDLRRGKVPQIDGLVNDVDKQQFEQFLEQLRDGKS
jgi:hypothetical protein